jgi:RND family efflux transporter MFP subunit
MASAFPMLTRRLKLTIALPLVLGLGGLAALAWPRSEAHDAPASEQAEIKLVRIMKVKASLVSEGLSAIGEIRPERETDLGFRVSGKLIERRVDAGITVRKGELLARIEDQDYRNRLLSAKADQASADAVLVEAKAAEDRSRKLLEKGYTTRANHEVAVKNLRSAEAKLKSASVALAMAEDQLAYTELHADFDGIVTSVSAEPGQIVNTGQAILRLADPEAKDAVFQIAESVFADQHQGKPPRVIVSLLSNPQISVSGSVREIAPVADEATRTYKVKVALSDAPEEMRFGASVAGRVDQAAEPVVVLPGGALFESEGKPAVWTVDPASELELKSVTIARYEADRVIVKSGLDNGDIVVTAGVNRLREHQKVRFEGVE